MSKFEESFEKAMAAAGAGSTYRVARTQRKWQVRGVRADGGKLDFPVLAYDHAEASKIAEKKARGGQITDIVLIDQRRYVQQVKKSKALPKWNDKKGWMGGDSRRLYAYIDRLTGKITVWPGSSGLSHSPAKVGPNADVRPATRAEAVKHWQDPLHVGWKVDP